MSAEREGEGRAGCPATIRRSRYWSPSPPRHVSVPRNFVQEGFLSPHPLVLMQSSPQLLSLRLCISEAAEAIVCATCTYWRRLLAASIVRPTRLALHLAQPRCPRRLSIPTLSMTLTQVLDLVFLPVGFLTRRRRFECLCSISDIRTHTCLDMYKHDRLVRQTIVYLCSVNRAVHDAG